MTIHDLIAKRAAEYTAKTGNHPVNVYLGEKEIAAVKRGAYENQYVTTPDPDITGDNRPELQGLFVFAVNAPEHCECA